jgi:N-acetylneuraminic acid mutarotase
MIEPNSEFAAAELDGRIYVLRGYPAGRVTVRTVQIYDIAADKWTLGPTLPEPNNHGMAAAINGVLYLIGGQTDPQRAYVSTVYALDPKVGRGRRGPECPQRAALAASPWF